MVAAMGRWWGLQERRFSQVKQEDGVKLENRVRKQANSLTRGSALVHEVQLPNWR